MSLVLPLAWAQLNDESFVISLKITSETVPEAMWDTFSFLLMSHYQEQGPNAAAAWLQGRVIYRPSKLN